MLRASAAPTADDNFRQERPTHRRRIFFAGAKASAVTGGSATMMIKSSKRNPCRSLRKAASADSPARVINIASIDGMHTSPFSGYAYGTSKAAVIHLTRFMAAQHVGEHILVNGIAPGPFPTWMLSTGVGFGGKTEGVDWDSVAERNPSGRVGTPQDIAGLAMFLSSRAGAYISGHTIPCDGGIVASS